MYVGHLVFIFDFGDRHNGGGRKENKMQLIWWYKISIRHLPIYRNQV